MFESGQREEEEEGQEEEEEEEEGQEEEGEEESQSTVNSVNSSSSDEFQPVREQTQTGSVTYKLFIFKGAVCRIQGALLAEMEYNIHNYVFISV